MTIATKSGSANGSGTLAGRFCKWRRSTSFSYECGGKRTGLPSVCSNHCLMYFSTLIYTTMSFILLSNYSSRAYCFQRKICPQVPTAFIHYAFTSFLRSAHRDYLATFVGKILRKWYFVGTLWARLFRFAHKILASLRLIFIHIYFVGKCGQVWAYILRARERLKWEFLFIGFGFGRLHSGGAVCVEVSVVFDCTTVFLGFSSRKLSFMFAAAI